jgi:glycosyltransferase involved in cell wall biosynthesis
VDKLVIGQFSEAFPPLTDGVGFTVKNYVELLQTRGHEVFAIVSGSSEAEGESYDREAGITYTRRATMIPLPGIRPYGMVIQRSDFRKSVKKIPFSLVHSHSPFFLGRFAQQIARLHSIPLITTFHSLYKDDFYGATHSELMTEELTRTILKHYRAADAVWTPTEWSRKKLFSYGFDKDVEVIPNGCDFTIPTSEAYEAYHHQGRSIIDVPSHVPILLYVGQLKQEKNLNLLIDALDRVHRRHGLFHMVFVGSGPDRDLFEKRIEAAYLTPHVTFLGKITDREKLKALFAASTLFVFPSQYDTSALVLREAAAFSLPLLNTEGSATSDITIDNENGFIAPNTVEGYAQHLQRIIEDPKRCYEVGIQARNTLYMSWDEVIDTVQQRYSEIIEQKQRNHT